MPGSNNTAAPLPTDTERKKSSLVIGWQNDVIMRKRGTGLPVCGSSLKRTSMWSGRARITIDAIWVYVHCAPFSCLPDSESMTENVFSVNLSEAGESESSSCLKRIFTLISFGTKFFKWIVLSIRLNTGLFRLVLSRVMTFLSPPPNDSRPRNWRSALSKLAWRFSTSCSIRSRTSACLESSLSVSAPISRAYNAVCTACALVSTSTLTRCCCAQNPLPTPPAS
mmetsp:Transcript_6103/g.9515  ORF Transcript_6103/g.9515 Transcript_6103/m.9515 type:complete len:224 (-) Transcript_6103:684-1355(-)